MGDLFGSAFMRTMNRDKGVGLIADLRSTMSSRDIAMLLHAGGSLSRRIEGRATVLVATLCATLLFRSRRRIAATRIQQWWRFRKMQRFAKVRLDSITHFRFPHPARASTPQIPLTFQ